jgi:hypothetical protein
MRFVLPIGIVALAAALVLTSASAGPPPPEQSVFGSSHRAPHAGKSFTGITVGYIAPYTITQVDCHARVGDRELVGREQRFYRNGIAGPTTVSCSWRIPKGSAGKTLRAWARAYTSNGFSGSGLSAWRVKP